MANPGPQCPDCGGYLNPSGICPRCALAPPEVTATPEPEPASRPPGTPGSKVRYFGDYELLSESPLQGGMGVVYRARQTTTGRIVGLKLLPPEHIGSPERMARFRAEVEAVARLDHPNVLPFWEAGEHEGQPFYTMRWVEGGSLARQLSRWTVASAEPAHLKERERAAALLMRTLAQAVQHAHERGILHRDLKPGNVLIDNTGHAYVADFGLAKFIEENPVWARTAEPLTQAPVGSPGYMAPEQAVGGRRAVTTAADVYSLGAILYVLLAGKPTFEGGNALEVLDKLRSEDPKPPSTHFRSADPDLEIICLKCLRREPAERYASAAALAEELDRWLRGEPIEARTVTDWERTVKWIRRRPALSALAALLILAVAFGGWQWLRAEQNLRSVRRSYNLSQLRVAGDLLDRGQTRFALMQLARQIRDDPSYKPAATLLLSALQERNLPWPVAGPFDHAAEVSRISFASDGRYVATGGEGGTAKVWPVVARLADPGARAAAGAPLNLAHGSWIWHLEFSLDGRYIGTGGEDRFAKIWALPSGRWCSTIEHSSNVTSVSFSPDGNHVVTTSADQTARVSEALTGAKIVELTGHRTAVLGATFSRDGRFVLTVADDLRAWDWRSGRLVCPPIQPTNRLSAIALGPRSDRLVFGTFGGEVSVREFKTGGVLFDLPRHSSVIVGAEFSGDGLRILTADRSVARVWDAHDGHLLSPELKHPRNVTAAHFSPDGAYLATACEDGLVRVWDTVGYEPACEPIVTGYFTYSLAFSPEGHRLATASGKGIATVWDIRAGKALPMELAGHAAQFATSGQRVLTASAGGIVRQLDASDGRVLLAWTHTNHVGTRFSPDGRAYADATTNGVVRVWSTETGEALTPPLPHSAPPFTSVFDRLGQRLFTALENPVKVFVWEIPSGRLLASHEIPRTNFGYGFTRIVKAEFAPNRQTVVLGSEDGRVLAWDFDPGTAERTLLKYKGGVFSLGFSSDGRRLAVASLDRTASLVEWPSGRVLATLQHDAETAHTGFSPNGRKLVTTSLDGTARLWNGVDGRSLIPPLTHAATVRDADFSPDGERLATGCWDGTALIWDLGTGRPLTAPMPHPDRIAEVQFSPDGQRLLARYEGGRSRLWDVPAPTEPTPQWLAELAGAIAGERLDREGNVVSVGLGEWVGLARSLAANTNTDLASRWARWFVSDRGDRTISFQSSVRVADVVRARIEEGTIDSLQAAVRLAPTNSLALMRLAGTLLEQPAERRPHRVEEADFYSDRAMEFGDTDPEVRAVRAKVEDELARTGLPTVSVRAALERANPK